jgi:hypothetical protein
MTIMDALFRTDALKPNSYANPEKIRWLSILDGMIKKEIIDTHEGGEDVVFNGYEEDVDLTTELLVPAPYDDIYIHWLTMHIDYTNGEYGKYQNSMSVYNTAYTAFANYYNRTHMPKGSKLKFF